MRERFLEVFDHITIDCLNGDKYKTGKKSPDGTPDPSVFSAEHNREGIQVGTAIALLERWPGKTEAKKASAAEGAEVGFKNWWGKDKRAELVASLDKQIIYEALYPSLPLGLPLMPLQVREDYAAWPMLNALLAKAFAGVKTARDADLVSIDLEPLKARIARYFDKSVSHENMRDEALAIMEDDARFDAKATRDYLRERGINEDGFMRYCYRPFDVRWLYWDRETKLLDERRADFRPNIFAGNLGMVLAQRTRKGFEPPVLSTAITSYHVIESVSLFFPLFVTGGRTESRQTSVVRETPDMFGHEAGGSSGEPVPNLTAFALAYLAKLSASPEDLFFHIVAILHAPAYGTENAGALRQDWPRIPLPASGETLRQGAALGREVATLLDPETDAPSVTSGSIRPELKGLAELTVTGTAQPKTPDLSLTARWGYAGQGGVVMPGPGLVRSGTRGDGFLDIHLNATTCWRDVPAEVWAYPLGGYQVLKKWLSYREAVLLHRPLTTTEAYDFTKHVRRIAALLAHHPRLDAHYRASTLA